MPTSTCRASASQHSVLLLRNAGSDAKDVLKWKVARGALGTTSDLRDPTASATSLGLCLYDTSANPQPLLASSVLGGGTCGAKPCWKHMAGGYRYKNKTAAPDGVTDMKLRVSGAGELALLVKGKGANLGLPSLDLTPPVRLQLLVRDGVGLTCWESRFPSALKHDASTFRANGN